MFPISRSSLVVLGLAGSRCIQVLQAQLVDETQVSPTVPGGTIGKSLEEQVGAGRGDVTTPQSSVYLIKRDPARSIRRGRQLFQRKFTTDQGLGPRVNPSSTVDISTHPALGAGLWSIAVPGATVVLEDLPGTAAWSTRALIVAMHLISSVLVCRKC